MKKLLFILLIVSCLPAIAGKAPCYYDRLRVEGSQDQPIKTWYGTYYQTKFGLYQHSIKLRIQYHEDAHGSVNVCFDGTWHTMEYIEDGYNHKQERVFKYKCECGNILFVGKDPDNPWTKYCSYMGNYNPAFKNDYIFYDFRESPQ